MKRKTAARIAGLTAWERNRPAMIAASQKGGRTCAEKHGRSYYVRLAARRWDKEANGGRRNTERRKQGAGTPRASDSVSRPPASS